MKKSLVETNKPIEWVVVMQFQYSQDGWDLDELVMIHGLKSVHDQKFAIEGIALDLGITPEGAKEMMISAGHLQK